MTESAARIVSEVASEEDVRRWREEFSRARGVVWLPGWHYHDQSDSYVHGVRTDDGCWVCDNQWPLVERAMRDGERVPQPLCVVVPQTWLARIERRMSIFGEFFYLYDEVPDPEAFQLDDLDRPTRDDVVRWRRQFSRVIEVLRKKADDEEARFREAEKGRGLVSHRELSSEEVVAMPDGPLQRNVFGGFDPVADRKRKRRRRV